MISNEKIQASVITKLQASAALVARLKTKDEIKEDQWQGTTFAYPAVRVVLGSQTPSVAENCVAAAISLSVMVSSEDASSKQADEIAGIIANHLNKTSWSNTIQGVRFASLWVVSLIPAIHEGAVWKSEVRLQGLIEVP